MAEMQGAGVTIEAEEAVAIAQQLIAALRNAENADAAERPYGPPTPANVYLSGDGSVRCRACETTPAVSEMAIFLQAMLPAASVRVPGGLRYTIARALLDVDVPPFDSLDDFSETLARYERGPRDQIVRRLLLRLDARRGLAPMSAADRRRHPQASALRRALREADARLYLQKVATEALTVTVTPRPRRPRRRGVAAASVAAGLLLIVGGEFLDPWHRALAALPLFTTPAANVVARDIELRPYEPRPVNAELQPSNAARRPELVAGRTLPRARRASNAERSSVKRAARVQPARARKASSSRGVLGRLRLNWLRTVFASS